MPFCMRITASAVWRKLKYEIVRIRFDDAVAVDIVSSATIIHQSGPPGPLVKFSFDILLPIYLVNSYRWRGGDNSGAFLETLFQSSKVK